MSKSAVTFVDDNGRDITAFIVQMKAAEFDRTGRIIGEVEQGMAYTTMLIDAGELWLFGDGRYDRLKGFSPLYVDVTAQAPAFKERPVLERAFSPASVKVDQEATMPDVGACTVTYTGPVSGSFEHPGGELSFGSTVPGDYTITFEAFPAMPFTTTITVEA